MKLIEIKQLALPKVKVIRFGRFADHRGYFTETFRKGELEAEIKAEFVQCNESFSRKGTFRGFHFQWSPYMGKMIRPITGRLIDFALDVRKDSETFGKVIAHDMPTSPDADYNEWIWLPPGFAHGILFPEDGLIEYFCTGTYSPGNEACISPLDKNIDWSLCNPELKKIFDEIVPTTELITDKDKHGITLEEWKNDPNSDLFTLDKVQ
jgi:dTDP-4-dehydrorhamnose 3,5-epimerase